MNIAPDLLVHTGIGGVTIVLIGVIYNSMSKRIGDVERVNSGIGKSIDKKMDKNTCDTHLSRQTALNIDVIDRLARIETKIDFIRNGNGKEKPK